MQQTRTTCSAPWRAPWRPLRGCCLLTVLAACTASLPAAPLDESDAPSVSPALSPGPIKEPTLAPLQALVNQVDSRLGAWQKTRRAYQAAATELQEATTAYDAGEGDLTTLITAEQDFTTAEFALLETSQTLLGSTAANQRLRVESIMDIRTRARDRAFGIWRGVYALYLGGIGEITSEDEALAREHYLACRHRLEQALPLSAD